MAIIFSVLMRSNIRNSEKEEEKDRQMLGMADEVEKLRRDNASYEKQYIEILSESLKSEENSKLNDETISLLR